MKTKMSLAIASTLSVLCIAMSPMSYADTESNSVDVKSKNYKKFNPFKKLNKKIKTNAANIAENTLDINDLEDRVSVLENTTPTNTTVIDVDCGEQTVSDVLASAPTAGALTLNVSGVCTDTILIDRSNVSLIGADAGAVINFNDFGTDNAFTNLAGVVNVVGAQNVVIDNLTLSNVDGNGVGLNIQAGSSVALSNSTIENAFSGIVVQYNSHITMRGTTIQSNTRGALLVIDQSSARLTGDNTIVQSASFNGDSWTALVGRNSSVRVDGVNNVLINDAVEPGARAIELFQAGSFRNNSGLTINGNVGVFQTSQLEFRNVELNGSTVVDSTGVLRLRGRGGIITLNGDVNIGALGTVSTVGSSTINGNVICSGGPLSYFQINPVVTGSVDPACTTF
ncbi:MAG: right-handed parallel beta-helix repeat-containing protein [Cellvibrionaceae bacterium]